MRFILSLFIASVLLGSCSQFSKVQKSTDYEYKLKMADKYFSEKKYHQAQMLYEELFPVFKGTSVFEDLYYKYAYTFFNQRDYLGAENYFKGFLEVFPTSPRAEEMDYMRAYSYYMQSPKVELDQTNTHKAISLMQTFINSHPGSPRVKEANEIIDKCREKLEKKAFISASLYYNLGHFQAAGIAFTELMNNFPDSEKSEEYKLQVIKSYFQYADMSVVSKKGERFERVIDECNDFTDRYPESNLLPDAKKYLTLSQNQLNALKNEQVKETAGS